MGSGVSELCHLPFCCDWLTEPANGVATLVINRCKLLQYLAVLLLAYKVEAQK